MSSFDTAAIIDLAEVVHRDGLDAHAATLFVLADQANAVGVSEVVVAVMLDATEPGAARLRAFTIAAAAVAHRSGSARTGHHAAPALV